jgi:hypothetical protein
VPDPVRASLASPQSRHATGWAASRIYLVSRASLVLVILLPSAARAVEPAPVQVEFFETRVRPVLVRHCYECHGAGEARGGLRLDSRDGWQAGGESGPAVVPGDPGGSLLLRAVRHADPAKRMPRDQPPLPDGVIADLERWVGEGAPDPRDHPPTAGEAAEQAWQAKLAERRQWWSLQPLTEPTPPPVRDLAWSARPIDRFLLAKLEAAGLAPARPAAPAVLARRLSFVLTGLPPDPRDVAAFAADAAPDAYARFVDRTLASPHFGERWARHWMDAVRYGDTYGYEWDIPARGAWRYRDYLIRAFNDDVPFDQLVREHLAGDLLPQPRLDAAGELNESLLGTMFYQLGEKRHGDSADFNGVHQEMLNNKVDALSKAFQATTIACARCHDHKIDAVSQRDYYAVAGALMSPRWVARTLDTPKRHDAVLAELRELKKPVRAAAAAAWAAEVKAADCYLQAANPATPADPALSAERLDAWRKVAAEEAAKTDPAHPLFAWKATAAAADVPAVWASLAVQYGKLRAERSAKNAQAFLVLADFSRGTPEGWSVEGVGLRDGPAASGDFTVALEEPRAVGQVLPAGLFTHALSPKLNGAVRSPYLHALPKPYVSVETAGGEFAAYRTVVDNAFLTERQSYLASAALGWATFAAAPTMKDRRVYVEFATKASNPNFPPRVGLGPPLTREQIEDPRSWFGVTRVIASDGPGTPEDELTRFARLFEGDVPKTPAEVAARYARWLGASVEAWAAGTATDDDVRLLNWMLEKGLLSNTIEGPGREALAAAVRAYREAERRVPEPRTANGMLDADAGFDVPLNPRGVYEDVGPVVPRGYPVTLGGPPVGFSAASPGSGRLELAACIASRDNPLTARVFVNRVWHWLFGTGIVATPDDFGRLGDAPSHPELLDHLASRFVAEGWSVKRLVRSIVLSETFRQSGEPSSASATEVDPRNRLLHHYPLRRLEAESVRDAMLAVSGRLDPQLYGPPVDPPRAKEDPDKRLFGGPVDGAGRRSIYTKVTIMEPPRFLAVFNQPNPKIPTGRRDVTNVPAQALAMLNDPFVIGQAEFWATRLVAAEPGHASVDARLAEMFERALGRPADADERARWQRGVTDLAALHGVPPDAILGSVPLWTDVAHALFNAKELIYVR